MSEKEMMNAKLKQRPARRVMLDFSIYHAHYMVKLRAAMHISGGRDGLLKG